MSSQPKHKATIHITDLARQRDSVYAQGDYDHQKQLLVGIQGDPTTTSTKDEDAGSSTTFWDGESA